MKKIVLFLALLVLTVNCKKSTVQKPDKFIDEATMANIIYDLSVVEAMKSKNPAELSKVSAQEYVYKKYKIDSLQFVENNRYYAANIDTYKKIYDDVAARIESEKNTADSLVKAKGIKITDKPNAVDDKPMVK